MTTLKFSVEEYLDLERQAERKSEFHDGEIFPVIDASIEHSSLAMNLAGILQPKLRKTDCKGMMGSPYPSFAQSIRIS